jgi:hypothetical protein
MENDLDRQDGYLVAVLGENLAIASIRLVVLLAAMSTVGGAAAYFVL